MAKSAGGPPLRFNRKEKKPWKGSLDVEAHGIIEAYQEYHAQETGEEKPSPEEVVEGALRLLGEHKGFKKFLDEWREKKAAGDDGAGASKGASKGSSKGGARGGGEGD